MLDIKSAKFLISVSDFAMLPNYNKPEIAIVGKSNVGKSSFINFLTNNGRLAKTSATPGKTRLLNYFEINGGDFVFVDLPGYGYAKVSENEKNKWRKLIEGYFDKSKYLAHVFLLVDIRHTPGQNDLQMIAFLYHYNIPFTVIATKADKLSMNEKRKQTNAIATALGLGIENILTCSARLKEGREQIFLRLAQILKQFPK